MNITRNLLIAAAISGAMAAPPVAAQASPQQPSKSALERMGCNGKAGKGKHSCKGHSKQDKQKGKKKVKDKSACAGKHKCSGKAGKAKKS